ncbi:unnamed protein product [Phytomonas sp. EM1]|nr:unnamed protein product [Phytomonas sp. EM1]|eukprot:CCW65781.1 unnamed protein product [Phytomonas sp. isolate EM1]
MEIIIDGGEKPGWLAFRVGWMAPFTSIEQNIDASLPKWSTSPYQSFHSFAFDYFYSFYHLLWL